MPFTYTSKVEEPEFILPPEGEYMVRITKATPGVSKTSGKDQMIFECSVINEKFNAKVWYYITDDEYAQEKIFKLAKATGVTLQEGQTVTPNLFANKTGKIKLVHDSYNGKKKAKIHYWIKAEPAAQQPQTSKEDDMPF